MKPNVVSADVLFEEFRGLLKWQWIAGLGLWGKAVYVGMCMLQVVVAIIPGEPLEIAGGYAFGAWQGTALCLAGAMLGSVAVFALLYTLVYRAT